MSQRIASVRSERVMVYVSPHDHITAVKLTDGTEISAEDLKERIENGETFTHAGIVAAGPVRVLRCPVGACGEEVLWA